MSGPARTGDDAPPAGELTRLLQRARTGDAAASASLLPLVYDELRRLARARMARLPAGHTLQPTALVHEVYLDVLGRGAVAFEDRRHFFGVAARAMRDVLVDHVRHKQSQKRGGGVEKVGGEAAEEVAEPLALPLEDMLALDVALTRLAAESARAAQVVELSYFAGLTHPEIAELLGTTTRTVERDWRFARAWLHRALSA